MNKKIKWGIVGLGRIAHKFANDLTLVENAELVAVASSDIDRSKVFAEAHEVPTYYGNYQSLYKDKNIDVVYIATMHHIHARESIAAMNHKKHVLCEKPIAVNSEDASKMIEASQRNEVFFMEAFWSRFNPSIVKIKELIDSGEIGKVRYINADFTFYNLEADVKGRILNTNYAGGSLLDVGIYPLFLSYLILGKPNEILARSKFFHTGAEIQTSMILDYPDAQAILYSGFASNTEMKAKICGEIGEIYIHPVWHETQGFTMVINGNKKTPSLPTTGKGYAHEILEVHRCITQNQMESSLWSHQNSLDLIKMADDVRAQSGIKFPFEK